MRTRTIASSLSILGLVVFCGYQFMLSSGIVGQTLKPGVGFVPRDGCFCHSDSLDESVAVWIEGPDSLPAGIEALYTVYIYKDSNIAAGFDVAAFFGDLGIVDSQMTQLLSFDPADSLEVTHTQAKFGTSDTISWQFLYRAPMSPGVVDTLYSVGNAVDADGGPGEGDRWNFGPNLLVRILSSTGVNPQQPIAKSFSLAQNYPNPFNPSTTIRFTLESSSRVTLKVFDLTGREIAQLVNGDMQAGTHDVLFSAESGGNLASGMYLYRIEVAGSFLTKKMVLLQ